MKSKLIWFWLGAKQAIKDPTNKQKESYGRFFLTLSAASVIGLFSTIFTDASHTQAIWQKVGLFVSAVLCFSAGGVLSKGETND